MEDAKFYRCNHCGNIVAVVVDGGVTPVCCGEPMELLVADTTDAATEKHVPVAKVENNNLHVTVGEVEHPMTEKHYIQWIALVSGSRINIKKLTPEDKPECYFGACANGYKTPHTVYAYCNLHGLWKCEL